MPRRAEALPSFARQTGQPCGQCHTDFPGLTAFGRRFKLGGYTLGGGDFRTTPFPATEPEPSPTKQGSTPLAMMSLGYEAPSQVLKYAPAANAAPRGAQDSTSDLWFPPIALATIIGYTHTQAPLPPPTAPFNANDNVVASPFSAFYAGAITDHIGAFVQVTHNAVPPGGFPDPFGHTWTWDNTDVRIANTGKLGDWPVVYGVTMNNNPTVQDVWNTTPAWTFPYAVSTVAPTPAAKTIIDGTFAAHVASVGGYLWINDSVYLEATAYRTLDFSAQNRLGTDPFSAPGLFEGVAPYFRAAFEPNWGDHWLEVGAFAMYVTVNPWVDPTFTLGTTATFPQSDKFTDVGVDTQYQYKGENFWFTLRGSLIHEDQRLDASFANGLAANPRNQLNTLRAQASLAYGNDNRIVLTGQYFNTWGSSDVLLFNNLSSCTAPNTACSPDSNGWIAEIAYIPFMTSRSPGWPWANARIGVQYIWYSRFDGDTIRAHDNNTLFVYAWFAL